MIYAWTDDLTTGNRIIDAEHKQLFLAVESLHKACSDGLSEGTIERTMSFMINYMRTHFAHEERMQYNSRYPNREEHTRWHREYYENCLTASTKLKTSDELTSLTILNLLIASLVTHIKTEDARLADHVKDFAKAHPNMNMRGIF